MKLRADLQVLPLTSERDCLVVDDIGGRFSRTKRTLWNQLKDWLPGAHGDQGGDASVAPMWQQAAAAGWTQTRSMQSGLGWSPLSVKIPIASMDPIARRLVGYSDWVFSPKAILCWMMAAFCGLSMLLIRWDHWSGSVPSLSKYLASMTPWSVGGLFVLTKAIHEIGHAVACRRLGSRCGVVGVWFLCGIPCPYVDVTEVWRQPNSMRRAAVMAAGMVAEGVVCILAIWVWVLADSATVRLAAMNVMLVCGVSTLLFNANPLMRYDGYYILSDLIDSANLRAEASKASLRILSSPLKSWCQCGVKAWFLSVYHGASMVYRVFIFAAIGAMILAVADQWQVWRVAFAVLLFFASIGFFRASKGWFRMLSGEGKWTIVPAFRRRVIGVGGLLVLIAILGVPVPRYRHIQGRLEASDTALVYLPGEGVVDEVHVRVGEEVRRGQTLASLNDPELAIQLVSNQGQADVLDLRARKSRLASLVNLRGPVDAPEKQWGVLDEAVAAAKRTQAELVDRDKRLTVLSPTDGIVLGGESAQPSGMVDESGNQLDHADPQRLSPGVGERSTDSRSWCRVAHSPRMQVALPLHATDHDEIQVGSLVRFTIPGKSQVVYETRVRAVSPLRADSDEQTGDTKHTYQAIGDVSDTLVDHVAELPRWDGAVCKVVAHLPSKALWREAVVMARDAIGF